MTEEQLGQLMQARARSEGHRPALPEMSPFSAHLQSTADARRRQMETDVADAMAQIVEPTTPSRLAAMIPDTNLDQVQNALRRLKSRDIVKTIVVTTKRLNKTMWVLT